MTDSNWLLEFAVLAEKTDRFAKDNDHAALLASGLIGEAGSIISELKKKRREHEAYPVYRDKINEEIGDFLWYFVRLSTVVANGTLETLQVNNVILTNNAQLTEYLDFGAAVGEVLSAVSSSDFSNIQKLLQRVWTLLTVISEDANISLRIAAERNNKKTKSRWPDDKQYAPLFDSDFQIEEQLPRQLNVDFIERSRGTQKAVILRCNNINFGDRLTDNIEDPDGYRFHDIFHFANAVYLGWSPVVRALMRTKRKSDPKIDEAQDGARAVIIEEAVSAIIFSRAKQLNFFEGLDQVDLDLLKTIQEFVKGFEVDKIPLWQWETAIIQGYSIFRKICAGSGGRVTLDIHKRELQYSSLPTNNI